MEDAGRATSWPIDLQRRGLTPSATDRSWARRSRRELSDSSYNAAPEHRTWQKDRSLQNLSNCINEYSHVLFRRFLEHAMAKAANRPRAIMLYQGIKKSFKLPFEFFSTAENRILGKVAL